MTPPPADDDDDEPEYPPPQFIAQPGKPAKLSRREQKEAAKLAEAEAALTPKPPVVVAPPPPVDDAWTPVQAMPPVEPTTPPAPPQVTEPPPVDNAWSSSAVEPAPQPTPQDTPASDPAVVVTEWATPPSVVVAAADTEPLLPSTFHENDLRAAIGSPLMPEQIRPVRRPPPPDLDDDDDGDGRPRNRKAIVLGALAIAGGLGIAALVLLGRFNSDHYAIGCEAKQVIAVQGRSFPPWGTSSLGGAEWKAIPIPPSFQCVELETDDVAELHDAYRKMLVDRADAMLTAREVTQVDDAAGMLEQALLHARSDRKVDIDARRDIQRMLGDVGYWRASAKLREASGALADAAKQFETAAAQLPRHAPDASAWASYIRKLVEDLRAGPSGAAHAVFPPVPPTERTDRAPAPPGVALPVEPGAGSAEPPAPTPDAGPPGGGVLL